MPDLDVSDAYIDPSTADRFTVIRRAETINGNGRSELITSTIPNLIGAVYPTGDNSLVRTEDYQISRKTLTVVTSFRLQLSAPGYQPDIVVWNGDNFIVRALQDYSGFGSGMIVAECTSIDSQDNPPGTPQIGQV
jgi:hypothetical protein